MSASKIEPAAGRPGQVPEPWTLDARRLNPERAVIRLMRRGRDGHHADLPGPDDYLPFTTAGLRAVSRVTVAAIERRNHCGREIRGCLGRRPARPVPGNDPGVLVRAVRHRSGGLKLAKSRMPSAGPPRYS